MASLEGRFNRREWLDDANLEQAAQEARAKPNARRNARGGRASRSELLNRTATAVL
jgi:hypothetical protein